MEHPDLDRERDQRYAGWTGELGAEILGGGRNVFLADLQALLEAAAHQTAPDHLGLEAGLQRFRPDTAALQGLGELLGRQPHPLAHSRVGLIHIAGGRIDAESLGFLDLHLFVGQFVDHFLPRHLLPRGQEVELGTLLDIEGGDGFAVDHAGHGLRRQRRNAAGQHGKREDSPAFRALAAAAGGADKIAAYCQATTPGQGRQGQGQGNGQGQGQGQDPPPGGGSGHGNGGPPTTD